MKYVLVLTTLVLSLAVTALAEETLLQGDVTHGWYGAPVVKFTEFNGEFGVLAGGQGGWIINHLFALGGGGYGMATVHKPGRVPTGYRYAAADTRTHFSYGGVMLSYIGASNHVLHPTFDLLIGGGEINGSLDDDEWFEDDADYDSANKDAFFVMEPTVNAEVNVASFMRVQAGAGYRIVTGVDDKWGFSNDDLSGVTGSVVLKFGRF